MWFKLLISDYFSAIATVTNIFQLHLQLQLFLFFSYVKQLVLQTEIEVQTSVTQVSTFNSLTESVGNSVLSSQQLKNM